MVTLARSVAHLSSEMRNLQVVMQEVEQLRMEMQQVGAGTKFDIDNNEFLLKLI